MPYVGEIRLFAGNFAPSGWMFCEGQTIAISENNTLFQLLGTTFGGDGQETFNLPDLRGRVPIHMGSGPDGTTYQMGEAAGVEAVTLTPQQIPNHTHPLDASTGAASTTNPGGGLLASPTASIYTAVTANTVQMSPQAVQPAGGSQPHENRQPFLCINFIISMFGVVPTQT
jgi:microcystin-dependent protein